MSKYTKKMEPRGHYLSLDFALFGEGACLRELDFTSITVTCFSLVWKISPVPSIRYPTATTLLLFFPGTIYRVILTSEPLRPRGSCWLIGNCIHPKVPALHLYVAPRMTEVASNSSREANFVPMCLL